MEWLSDDIIVCIGKAAARGAVASLARTNRRFHAILNPLLYRRNAHDECPSESCLLWAAQNGVLETMRHAQSVGANLYVDGARTKHDIPGPRASFATPLHIAIQKGFLDIVDYLLVNGADINAPSTAFCVCRSHYTTTSTTSSTTRLQNWYPLHTALVHADGDHRAAEMLLRHGASFVGPGEPFDLVHLEASPLHIARLAFELRLFSPTSPVHGPKRLPAIHYAADRGNLGLAKIILEQPEINAAFTDDWGRTVLHLAASNCSVEFIQLLLDRTDVDASVADKGNRTVLHCLACRPWLEGAQTLVRQCIDRGVFLDRSTFHPGITAFHLAIKLANFPFAHALYANAANPYINAAFDSNGWSSLHYCLSTRITTPRELDCRRSMVGILIQRTFNVNKFTRNRTDPGRSDVYRTDGTPLFFAAVHAQDVDCMKLLLRHGAKANAAVVNRDAIIKDADGEGGMASWTRKRGRWIDPRTQSFLAGFFRHVWDRPYAHKSTPAATTNDVRQRVCLLLWHGTWLMPMNKEESALEYACARAAKDGDFSLLDLLLQASSRQNLSIEHVENVMQRYGPDHGERHDTIFQKLTENIQAPPAILYQGIRTPDVSDA